MLNKVKIIQKIKELNFSPKQYLVFSGGSLAAHGIRETSDVDMVVTPELFSKLKETDEWKCTTKNGDKEYLSRGDVEMASKLEWDDYPVTLTEAKQREDIIESIPFMSLNDVIHFKQAMNRPKDFADIALIKNYLQANKLES